MKCRLKRMTRGRPAQYSQLAVVLPLVALWGIGCDRASSTGTSNLNPGRPGSVRSGVKLRDVVRTYQELETYCDVLEIRLLDGANHPSGDAAGITVSTTFRRPNKLSLVLRDEESTITVASDGEWMSGTVDDRSRPDLKRQRVLRPAPDELAWHDVMSCVDFLDIEQPNELLNILIGFPWDLANTPLGMALSKGDTSSMPVWFEAREINDERWDQQLCRCFAYESDWVVLKYWVSESSRQLLRVTAHAAEGAPPAPAWELLVRDARPNRSDLVFGRLMQQPRMTSMKYFVLPPQPLPHPRIGEVVPPFSLPRAGESEAATFPLTDQAVLLVWYRHHRLCQEYLQLVQQVGRHHASDVGRAPGCQIVAVLHGACADGV